MGKEAFRYKATLYIFILDKCSFQLIEFTGGKIQYQGDTASKADADTAQQHLNVFLCRFSITV